MNYIMFNGQRIDLTEDQVKEIAEASVKAQSAECKMQNEGKKKLSEVEVEDTFNAGKFEFIKLEQMGDDVLCLLKDTYVDDVEFGKNNNFDGSNYDEICKQFEKELAEVIGADNIVEHTVDLTSDDGLKDYGTVRRKVSGFTTELARRYVHILDKYKLRKWWWLVTPWSTPTHEDADCIKCFSPRGRILDINCTGSGGVRPFLRFSSSIFDA